MAGSSSVVEDDSILSRLDQSLYRIEQKIALVSGITVLLLVLLAVVSVSGRTFFNHPLPGYVDWIEQAMPLIAFLGISFLQRDGGHIRMDILVGALRGQAQYLAELLTSLAMLALMTLLVWGSWAHFQRSFAFDAPLWSRDSSMDIALPIWPAKLIVPFIFSVLCMRLILQIVAYTRALIRNDQHPAAVPLVLDAATQAAIEAEHVSGHEE